MAIYDTVKGNIVRQELQLIEAGQHYKSYSAKVRYSPENIEKEDFFRLCYGMLTKCDEINLYTYKKDEFEVCYKFVVIEANIENKSVTTRMTAKIDFLASAEEPVEGMEVSTLTLAEVQKLIKKEIKAISEVIVGIDTKLDDSIEASQQYQTATDDQLEEIETKLEELKNGEESSQPEIGQDKDGQNKVDQSKGTTKTETKPETSK